MGKHLLGTVALLQEGIVMSDTFPAFIVGIDDGLVLSDAPIESLDVPLNDGLVLSDAPAPALNVP
ncbi:MAG: hypothetical protein JXR84_15365, partial [Anaerolineae bacterium]|nr:hypothetical protein [Anaerolineae bacterium]